MASAFSHAFVGASLVGLAPIAARRWSLALALAAVAILPDLDVIGLRLGVPYGAIMGHRGWTHSLSAAALVGIAAALWQRASLGSRDACVVGLVFFLACTSHGVLDAFTDAGLGVGFLLPFVDERYFAPWRPLVTSPTGITRFFSGWGLRVLANEATYIWLPLGAILLGVRFGRRRQRF